MNYTEIRSYRQYEVDRDISRNARIDPEKENNPRAEVTYDNVLLGKIVKNNVRITQEQADDYNFGHSLISGLSYSTIMVLNTELEDRLRKEKRAINFKLAKSLIEEHNSKVPRDEQKPNLANAISDEDLESLVIELQNK